MASLDTNVLVRWLMADDAAQTAHVDALFGSASATNGTLFVPITGPCTCTAKVPPSLPIACTRGWRTQRDMRRC
jgi:hypothetical protein